MENNVTDSKIPPQFLKLRDNIEKKFLEDFTKPLITGCEIEYRFENIQIKIFPSICYRFFGFEFWYGEIDYIIYNSSNKMVEKVIHLIFKELNEKYKNKLIDKELAEIILENIVNHEHQKDCLIKENPIAWN